MRWLGVLAVTGSLAACQADDARSSGGDGGTAMTTAMTDDPATGSDDDASTGEPADDGIPGALVLPRLTSVQYRNSLVARLGPSNIGGDVVEMLGGACDDRIGWFVPPTVIVVRKPDYRTMREELFGPVLSVFVYDEAAWDDTLVLVDETTPHAVTGAVFAEDRAVLAAATAALRHSAGNFYLNDKPTGAVVGQQPFGGGRASGTNDEAGSMWNLIRWCSPRAIKETFAPPTAWRYPYMG